MLKRDFFAIILIFSLIGSVRAEQLEPRAYWPAPINMNVAGIGYFYSSGDAVFDPSVPIKNVRAYINVFAPYYGRTFGLFGHQSGIVLAAPYIKGTVKGDVYDSAREANREGPGDPTVRFSFNLIGSPALDPTEFSKRKPGSILGTSLTVIAPYGQYDSTKLINIGTHRWAFKPEVGFVQPIGNWAIELFTGVWMFTNNDNFFGGKVKEQDPLYTSQAHLIRELGRWGWTALDFTYYAGGTTTVNGDRQTDRQDNTRTGLTLAIPVTKRQWVKFGWSRGVSTRVGSKFETIGATWQVLWF